MIFAIIILFVSSLLVTAALVTANGDIKFTHTNTSEKKAYYAALAGISAYKDQLQANPYYWKKCPRLPAEEEKREPVSGATEEEYVVQTVPSETPTSKHTAVECKSEKESAILQGGESKGAAGSFRIELTGYAGIGYAGAHELTCEDKKVKALSCVSVIATFTHPGFLDYVYFTAYEILDPFAQNPEPTNCEHYYQYRKEHNLISECGTITFASSDKVNGPMHTNDAASVDCGATFGRENHHDKIEINGGYYGCSEVNMLGEYIKNGATLTPPETDSELLETAGKKFQGKTIIELKPGTPNTMKVITFKSGVEQEPVTEPFPENGVIYVENAASGCPIKYTPFNSNYAGDDNCGNVYVRGEYTESLTIAAANDLIINGSLTTTHKTSGEPTGSAVLGLIATNFVRVYHPVKTTTEVAKETATTAPIVHKESCVKPRERTGVLTNKKTEVTGVSPTEGLTLEEEVTGTGIAAGTTITKIAGTTITLSKEATATGTETLTFVRVAKLKTNSKEVSLTTTANLNVGEDVSGTGIPSGTTITAINSAAKKVTLSQTPTKEESSKLTFYPANMTYNASLGKCVKNSAHGGWEFHSTELLYTEKCPSQSNYLSNGECEWEIKARQCPSGATNLNKTEDPRGWGSLTNLEVDAAILSTHHSFIVDNFECGASMGELKVWGSIAQFWRGPVGLIGGAGYIKDYNYDERLATNTPPQFLSPSTTSWKGGRVTVAPQAFEP